MVHTRLGSLLSVMDRFAKIKFDICSFEKSGTFEGTVRDFYKTVLYEAYSCDMVCEIKITGNYASGFVTHIKVAPPID